MIQLSGAGKRFGHKVLFENVDWLITSHDHIGLVGGNGTGKSTLMKVLGGMDTFDYGSLIVAKGTSAGYLPQDGLTLSGRTVFAECMSVFDDLRAMEVELESLMHSMAEIDHTSAEYANVADRYQRVEHEFRTRDGYSIEAEVGRVLMGLGFGKEDWPRLTDEFSGGWQMRLALAKAAAAKAQPAAAGRTDKPSGSRGPQLAGGISQRVSLYVRSDFARPVFPRRHGRQNRRNLE